MPTTNARRAIRQPRWPAALVLLAVLLPLLPAHAIASPGRHACCTPATAPCPVFTKARVMDCCVLSTPVIPGRSLGSSGFAPLWSSAPIPEALSVSTKPADPMVDMVAAPQLRLRGAPLFLLHSALLR
jgi:hypothetical protein